MATLGWVDWFNNRHLLGPIGNMYRGTVFRQHVALIMQPS